MSRANPPNSSGLLGTLRNPYVRAFAIGRAASTVGTQIVSVAVGWELFERTGDPWALGLTGLAQVVPALALMLPAGVVIDRLARRNVALLAHLMLGLAAFGLALVSWLNLPVELVYLMLALTGAGRAFASPAILALLPQLLHPRQFANANGWVTLTSQLASICGPALGGFLIALVGVATPAYAVAGASQLIFFGLLLTMPAIPPRTRGARHDPGGLFDGVGFVRRSPVFLAAITLDLFGVLLGGATALLPIYAKDILEVGPAGLGLLRSAPALGAVAMALLATWLANCSRPGRALLLVVVGYGIASIGFGLSRDIWLSFVCLFFTGGFNTISAVIRKTLQQVITPDRLRGRVAAITQLFTGCADELGASESGAVAALFGAVFAVVSGGVGTVVVVGIVALIWPALDRIGPLHTLHPVETEPVQASETARTAPTPG